jgi:preprotein translocase subunit SecA
LSRVYGLQVRKVAPRLPSQRRQYGTRIFRTTEAKQAALIDRVIEMQRSGRPLLIGTCSVEESEQASEWLQRAGIEHRVLNAKQDQQEAEIVATAGERGAVTVATNMAGRGTDIALGAGVDALGGLHVISISLNDSQRLDRQLFGRGARQGDPGSAEVILSLQDEKLRTRRGYSLLVLGCRLLGRNRTVPQWLSRPVLRLAQNLYETRQSRNRKALTKQDKHDRRILAFSGKFQ